MAKFLKFITWVMRIFQLTWSLIILGVTAYMADEFRKSGQNILAEIFVPLLFSIFALFTSFWSLLAICCLPLYLQLYAAILDFCILAGFIASAGLLANNFHSDQSQNPLRNWLIWVRWRRREDSLRVNRSGALVHLLDAAVILMILMYFFTTLTSFGIFVKHMKKHYQSAPRHDVETTTEGETTESSYVSGSGYNTRSGYDTRGTYDSRSGYDTTTTGYDTSGYDTYGDGYETRGTYDTEESSYVNEEQRGKKGYRRDQRR